MPYAMDLEGVRVFVRVAELGSFTRASEQLGLSKARASIRVQELEAELGCRLFHRSTRAVRLTEDGEAFLGRAQRLVRDADELASMFQAPSNLRGRVRIDLPIQMARDHVVPRLPALLASHPQLELLVSTSDRRVDVLREGFDCVLRVGTLSDSGLVARRLGVLLDAEPREPGLPEKIRHSEGSGRPRAPRSRALFASPRRRSPGVRVPRRRRGPRGSDA